MVNNPIIILYIKTTHISPIYQYIQHFEALPAPSGAGDANYFELLVSEFLTHFIKLMEAYQAIAIGEDKNVPI